MSKNLVLTLVFICMTTMLPAKDILISFDGSGYYKMWEETLTFAKQNNLKFTYFISAPYFITESDLIGYPYWALTELKERPSIGVMEDIPSAIAGISRRIRYVNRALANGHEIASHLCGHYDGTLWTEEQWHKEFAFFRWVMGRCGWNEKVITGVRAPYLGWNRAFFKALVGSGYTYDSSVTEWTAPSGKRYVQAKLNLTTLPVTEVTIKDIEIISDEAVLTDETETATIISHSIPFDYNFSRLFVLSWEDSKPYDPEKVFFDSLCNAYLLGPTPMQICLHFDIYPGQPYYKAMQRFVVWVADKNPEYKTYREYVQGVTK